MFDGAGSLGVWRKRIGVFETLDEFRYQKSTEHRWFNEQQMTLGGQRQASFIFSSLSARIVPSLIERFNAAQHVIPPKFATADAPCVRLQD
jgi:hypothetical protein